jgi:tetratricopeptide (TPR) repeat protein
MFARCWLGTLLICGGASAQSQGLSPDQLWKQHMDSGRALEDRGRFSEAKEEFAAALQTTNSFSPRDERNFVTRVELATQAASIGQYIEAEQWNNEAVRLGMDLYGKDAPALALPFTNLAALSRDQGDYDQAEELCRRALRLLSGATGVPPSARAHVLGTLGGILYRRGKLAEAETSLGESIQIAEKLATPDILAGDWTNLAAVYAKTGRQAEALATYRQAYAVYRNVGGSTDPSLFFVLVGMAAVQADSRQYSEAVTSIESGIRVAEAAGAGNTMLVGDALTTEAAWLHKLNREAEAKRVRARAKQVAKAAAQNSYTQYTHDVRQVARASAKRAD